MTNFLPPVGAIAPIAEPALAGVAPNDGVPGFGGDAMGVAKPSGASFGDIVSGGLQRVSEQLQANQVDLQKLASGDVENLHHVMLRMEETRISFQLMLQVRNRLLESYQEVMRMQV